MAFAPTCKMLAAVELNPSIMFDLVVSLGQTCIIDWKYLIYWKYSDSDRDIYPQYLYAIFIWLRFVTIAYSPCINQN